MTLRKSSGGFTLIELMIVVVIVGVLTMVAYPAYRSFTVKANRAEAKSYLMHLAQREQLYFNDSRVYATDDELRVYDTDDDGDGTITDDEEGTIPERVEDNYVVTFDLTTISPVPRFTITATPIDGTRQEADGNLSIDNTGEKLHAGEAW